MDDDAIELVHARALRYSKDAIRKLQDARMRAIRLVEDHCKGCALAEAFITETAAAMPWLSDAALVTRWELERTSRIILDTHGTLEEKCALLNLDVDAVMEKAGAMLDDATMWDGEPATKPIAVQWADIMAMFSLVRHQFMKGVVE